MTMQQWLARVTSEAAYSRQRSLPYTRALKGKFDQPEKEAFVRAAISRSDLSLLIEERSGLSAIQILSGTRKARAHFERMGKRLGLVVVDHVGKVRPSNRYKGNKVHEMGETSRALAELAKTEDVAVLALVQLNRGVEDRKRENRRPGFADLRDSGDLEQDTDLVLLAYREAYYLAREKEDEPGKERVRRADLERKKNLLEINVAKQRNGPNGIVGVWCDMASNVVRDLNKHGRVD
jgi:replicative DNA helicase